MTLRLYNSYGRKVQEFEPLVNGEVRMYTCGPTVWDYSHIGNFRTFLFEDVLRRYLIFKGYRVIQVKNITDIEDRIITGMKKTGKSQKELTEFYAKAFMEDLATLGIQKAEFYPRATQHISEMVSLIKTLMQKGFAYRGEDGSIYFDISKFDRYGELSGVKVGELKSGARVALDHYEKEEAKDFALWKSWDPEDAEVFWETEFGKGRPGWHIECSAMSMKYLGETFDIHTGGKDLRFPHHENEIAQSEAASGKKFVNYWLHSDFLRITGEEMHKSSGNIVTLRELLGKGWDPRAIRVFLMSAHYRDELNLTESSLRQADANIKKIDALVSRLREVSDKEPSTSPAKTMTSLSERLLNDFTRAMDEDLNTPRALAALYSSIKRINLLLDKGKLPRKDAKSIIDALKRIDEVLGVMRFEEEQRLPDELQRLVDERLEARKRRDFARADELREELKKAGIIVEDTPTGTRWKRG